MPLEKLSLCHKQWIEYVKGRGFCKKTAKMCFGITVPILDIGILIPSDTQLYQTQYRWDASMIRGDTNVAIFALIYS